MSIKVLIVEDEMLVAEDLSDFLSDAGYIVCGIALNALECFSLIEIKSPHVILMDIHLKGKMDGVAIAGELSRTRQIPVIFLTAYSDQAMLERVLTVEPASFISKPFNQKDVQMAIELACKKHYGKSLPADCDETLGDCVYVREGKVHKRVEVANICYVEAKGSYSEIVTSTKRFLLSYNLSYFLKHVRNPALKKVHRSYVVNINKVESLDCTTLRVNGTAIPVSRQYQKDVQRTFRKI